MPNYHLRAGFRITYLPEPWTKSEVELGKSNDHAEALEIAAAMARQHYGKRSPIFVRKGRKKIHEIPAGVSYRDPVAAYQATTQVSDKVTSAQYRLGVEIGKLVHAEMQEGMTYEQALSTLHHVRKQVEMLRALATA